jgi:hypothetical protein
LAQAPFSTNALMHEKKTTRGSMSQEQILMEHCALYRLFQNVRVPYTDENNQIHFDSLDDQTAEILAQYPEILRAIVDWGANSTVISICMFETLSGYTFMVLNNRGKSEPASVIYKYVPILESPAKELGVQAHGLHITDTTDNTVSFNIYIYSPLNASLILTKAAVTYGIRA